MNTKDPYSMTEQQLKQYLSKNFSTGQRITGDDRDFVFNLRDQAQPIFRATVGYDVASNPRGTDPYVELYELPNGDYLGLESDPNHFWFEVTDRPRRFVQDVFDGFYDGANSNGELDRFEYNIKRNGIGFSPEY